MPVPNLQNHFVSAIDERAPICLDRVPEWFYDLMHDANCPKLCIAYSDHGGIAPPSCLDARSNNVLFADANLPELLRRYLTALAASLLDAYIPSWRTGVGSSGTLILDAEGRTATFHHTTTIALRLQTA